MLVFATSPKPYSSIFLDIQQDKKYLFFKIKKKLKHHSIYKNTQVNTKNPFITSDFIVDPPNTEPYNKTFIAKFLYQQMECMGYY